MTEDDLAKARLALLAVRAALSYAPDARGVERYFLRGSRLPMSAEAAARALARLEKPQRIEASRVGSEITLACERITSTAYLKFLDGLTAAWAIDGAVYCAGIANDALLVTEEQFRGWAREYAIEVDGAGFSIDLPSCYLSQRPGPVREAVRQGAARFASFGTRPDDLMAEEQGRVIVVKDSATWSTPVVYAAVEGEEACDCGARASWQATDTRETPWRSWWLCSHCVAELLRPELLADIEKLERWADDVPSWETIEFAETVTKRLARIRRRWQRLTPPAELQAVFERFGNDAA